MLKLKIKLLSNITIIWLILFILIWILLNISFNKGQVIKENYFIGNVVDYKISEEKITLEIKNKKKIMAYYTLKNSKLKKYFIENIKYGTKIKLYGQFESPSKNTIPNTFNYKNYLKSKNIYNIIKVKKIKIINNKTNIFYNLKNIINKRINTIDKSGYLKTFITGNKEGVDKNVINSYQKNGISHLFAISGMHITLLSSMILIFLKKLNFNEVITYLIIFVFLIFYAFLTSFTPSIIRALSVYILFSLNKIFNLNIKNITLFLFAIFIILLFNYRLIYSISFLYSSITSFGLILSSNILKSGGYLFKILKVSLVAFLYSLPITILNFYEINLLSIIYNLLFVPLITIIVYPLSLICFIFPIFLKLFNILIINVEKISLLFANIKIFNLTFPKFNVILLIIYYPLVYYLFNLKRIKFLIYIIFLFCFIKLIPYLNINSYVYMLDVSQGDCFVIQDKFNKKNIMIDTGGSYNEYLKDNIITFLKSKGINTIDFLILTHGDYDHMGYAEYFVKQIKVKNVIFNIDEYNKLELKLIKILKREKISYYKNVEQYDKFQFLNTKLYDNENDNSNVIYFNYENYKFLFMGDASINKEKDLLEKYNLKNIDFLKVGHHGSDTSSSLKFINTINPKYSLISVGKNNKYGHPKKSVLNNLSNSQIYRTDLDGSVEIKLNKKGYKIYLYN